ECRTDSTFAIGAGAPRRQWIKPDDIRSSEWRGRPSNRSSILDNSSRHFATDHHFLLGPGNWGRVREAKENGAVRFDGHAWSIIDSCSFGSESLCAGGGIAKAVLSKYFSVPSHSAYIPRISLLAGLHSVNAAICPTDQTSRSGN